MRHNPSAYLIDSGLWSACKESRRVMERAFRRPEYHGHAEWGIITDESLADKHEKGLFLLPGVTSYALREGDVPRFLTVVPGRDLFILQPHDVADFGLGSVIHDSIPVHRPRPYSPCAAGYQIALEYDPAWDGASWRNAGCASPGWEMIFEELFPQILYFGNQIDCLWFIDYRIQAKLTTTDRIQPPWAEWQLSPGRKVFSGSDCGYVQTLQGEWPHPKGNPDYNCEPYGPWEFVEAAENHLQNLQYDDELYRNGIGMDYTTCIKLGVLACEYL